MSDIKISRTQKALRLIQDEGITAKEAAERVGITSAAVSKGKCHPSKTQQKIRMLSEMQETIESLRQQLAISEAEGLEQARLLGMSGEREAALLAEIERLHNQLAAANAELVRKQDRDSQYSNVCCQLSARENEVVQLRQQLAEKDAEMHQMRSDFCKAIDHAISLDIEGIYFLSCWNDGDWDTCREFGFEPSDALTSPKFVMKGGAE